MTDADCVLCKAERNFVRAIATSMSEELIKIIISGGNLDKEKCH
jgi:hypothetical protein